MWWAAATAALGVLEMLTLDLTLLMLAGGAGVATAVAWVGGPLWLQVLAGGATSLGLLVFVRPLALRHRRQAPELRTGTAALVGMTATTLDEVDGAHGLVKLNGETWSARSYDGTTIPVGRSVQVIEIDGATAKVLPQ